MRLYKKLSLFFLGMFFIVSHALPQTTIQTKSITAHVISEKCQLVFVNHKKNQLEKTQKHFDVGTKLSAQSLAGQTFFGLRYGSQSKLVLIQDPQNTSHFYVGKASCLFLPSLMKLLLSQPSSTKKIQAKSRSVPAVSAPTSTVSVLSVSQIQWESSFSLQTFKTQGTLIFANGDRGKLTGQVIGVLPELGFRRQYSRWEYSLSMAGVLGTAELGKSFAEAQSGRLSTVDYQASSLMVYGAELSPAVYFRPISKNSSLGFKIPIRWMKTNWPVPPEGSDPALSVSGVEPRSSIALSYLIENRLERDRFVFFQNIGFYKNWGDVLWSIGITYRL